MTKYCCSENQHGCRASVKLGRAVYLPKGSRVSALLVTLVLSFVSLLAETATAQTIPPSMRPSNTVSPSHTSTPKPKKAQTQQAIYVKYPSNLDSDAAYTQRTNYLVSLLHLALEKSGTPFITEAVPIETLTASRNKRYLITGRYDVNWMHTNEEREGNLQPVPVPLFKGLIGWRLLFVHRENLDFFRKITSIAEMKPLYAGHGHDWPDTYIFDAHKFNQKTASNRDSLIQMLLRGRVDYLSRSIIEIWDEQISFANEKLTVEPSIALYYPSAYYFFVSPSNKNLADILHTGLQNAHTDGSFNALFHRFFGEAIRVAKLKQRKVYELQNPYLSDLAPLDQKNLWFTIDTL